MYFALYGVLIHSLRVTVKKMFRVIEWDKITFDH